MTITEMVQQKYNEPTRFKLSDFLVLDYHPDAGITCYVGSSIGEIMMVTFDEEGHLDKLIGPNGHDHLIMPTEFTYKDVPLREED